MLAAKKLRTVLGPGFILWIVLGCAAVAPTPTPVPPTATPIPIPPTATPPAIPSGWKMFTSDKYHYSIAYPADWKVTPAMELLKMQSGGIPHRGDDTADTFESPDGTSTGVIEIAAQDVSTGTTLDDWTSTNIQSWKNGAACETASREPLRVAGESATLVTLHPCLAYYVPHVAIVHGHTGYLAYWFADPGNETKDRSTFQQFLATLTFAK